jgi:hypothetical protein
MMGGMIRRRQILAISAIIAAVLGEGFFVLWYATHAWVSATPISAEHLAQVQLLAWVVLAGMAICLAIGIAGVASLFRRP